MLQRFGTIFLTRKKRCSDGSQISEVDDETALKVSGPFAWNKLYQRELFAEIRYPESRVFEDLAVTHKLIFAAKRIVVLPDALYCYRDRKDSLSQFASAEKKRDGFLSALSFTENLIAHGIAKDV